MRDVGVAIAIACVALSPLFSQVSQAASKRSVETRLPRNYVGTFRWNEGRGRQRVEIRFDIVKSVDAQSIEAFGCGRYDASGIVTDIKVKMHISVPDLAIELFEREAEGSSDFIVDGSHVGNLSDDLRHLMAQWTTRATGQKGRLDLRAGGKLICSSALVREEHSVHLAIK
jgi:hypothetical protein